MTNKFFDTHIKEAQEKVEQATKLEDVQTHKGSTRKGRASDKVRGCPICKLWSKNKGNDLFNFFDLAKKHDKYSDLPKINGKHLKDYSITNDNIEKLIEHKDKFIDGTIEDKHFEKGLIFYEDSNEKIYVKISDKLKRGSIKDLKIVERITSEHFGNIFHHGDEDDITIDHTILNQPYLLKQIFKDYTDIKLSGQLDKAITIGNDFEIADKNKLSWDDFKRLIESMDDGIKDKIKIDGKYLRHDFITKDNIDEVAKYIQYINPGSLSSLHIESDLAAVMGQDNIGMFIKLSNLFNDGSHMLSNHLPEKIKALTAQDFNIISKAFDTDKDGNIELKKPEDITGVKHEILKNIIGQKRTPPKIKFAENTKINPDQIEEIKGQTGASQLVWIFDIQIKNDKHWQKYKMVNLR